MSRPFDPTLYSGDASIKTAIRDADLSLREVAMAVGYPYGTLSNKLNGFAPFPEAEREAVRGAIQQLKSAGGPA